LLPDIVARRQPASPSSAAHRHPPAPRVNQTLPAAVHVDNAAEFKSRAFIMGCENEGVKIIARPLDRTLAAISNASWAQ
jgi:hypothetical protein